MEDTKNLSCKNGTWYLVAMVKGARISRSLRTKSLTEARRKRNEILEGQLAQKDEKTMLLAVQRQLQGIAAEEEARRKSPYRGVLVADACKEWLGDANRRSCGSLTEFNRISQWKAFVQWLRDNHPDIQYCRQIERRHAREYSNYCFSQCKATRTYNAYMTTCRVVLAIIEQEDDCFTNPFSFIHHKEEKDAVGKQPFTQEELERIFACNDEEFKLLCAIGLYTTLRLSSALKVSWEDISDGYLSAVHEKTGADATLRIPEELSYWLDKVPASERHGRLFKRFPASAHGATPVIQKKLEDLGIATSKKVRGGSGQERNACIKGFHSFRHTAVTLALQNGATVASVRRLAGHATEQMQRRYTHLGADTAGEASACIGRFW